MSEPSTRDDSLAEVQVDRVAVHAISFDRAVELIARWAREGTGGYVCTPNVDHVVRARRDPGFLEAVRGARLRVPDGMGIVYGSRLAGRAIGSTVTGRLLPAAVGQALADTSRSSGKVLSIGLLGGTPGVEEAAAAALRRRGIAVAQAIAPRMGFELDSADDLAALQALRANPPAVLFVGLGAPRQELWMARHAPALPNTVLVGVGGAIDVLGGRVRPAPRWMTRIGLEWLFRLAQEPRRLARRYLWDDPRFFGWMLAQRRSARDR